MGERSVSLHAGTSVNGGGQSVATSADDILSEEVR